MLVHHKWKAEVVNCIRLTKQCDQRRNEHNTKRHVVEKVEFTSNFLVERGFFCVLDIVHELHLDFKIFYDYLALFPLSSIAPDLHASSAEQASQIATRSA